MVNRIKLGTDESIELIRDYSNELNENFKDLIEIKLFCKGKQKKKPKIILIKNNNVLIKNDFETNKIFEKNDLNQILKQNEEIFDSINNASEGNSKICLMLFR